MRFGIQFSLRGNGSLRCLDARAYAARQPFVPTLSHRYPKVSEFVAESTHILLRGIPFHVLQFSPVDTKSTFLFVLLCYVL